MMNVVKIKANKTWRSWTTRELDRLAEMRWQGMTATTIARELGRSLPSVKCRLQEGAVPRPEVFRRRWLLEFTRPHRIAELASRHDVTRHAVRQAKRRLRRQGFQLLPATWEGPPRCPAG